jgi:PTS system fructose-specific IIA component/PTS system nitrogen regulatory IIA component
MKLLELIHRDAIIAELRETERNGVIRELVEALARSGALEASQVEPVVKSIITRERTRGTTGFGKGVAVPHAKVEGVSRVVGAVGRSSRGVDFSSLDGEPVYVVFLVVSPTEQAEEHLRAMDLIFRHSMNERFRKFLRQSDQAEKIYELLREVDEKLLVN